MTKLQTSKKVNGQKPGAEETISLPTYNFCHRNRLLSPRLSPPHLISISSTKAKGTEEDRKRVKYFLFMNKKRTSHVLCFLPDSQETEEDTETPLLEGALPSEPAFGKLSPQLDYFPNEVSRKIKFFIHAPNSFFDKI